MVARAHFGPVPVSAGRMEINIDEPQHRWIRSMEPSTFPTSALRSDLPLDTPEHRRRLAHVLSPFLYASRGMSLEY